MKHSGLKLKLAKILEKQVLKNIQELIILSLLKVTEIDIWECFHKNYLLKYK